MEKPANNPYALMKFQHPWCCDDPVLDYVILRHDIEVYRQMMRSYDDDEEIPKETDL